MITQELLNKIQRPLTPDEVEWRVGNKDFKNGRTRALPYISARCANARLMELGLENFQVVFDQPFCINFDVEEKDFETKIKTVKNIKEAGLTCRVGLKFQDGWNWYSDGANPSAVDSVKGMYSDSKKRACVVVGIGNDLYDYPAVFVPGTDGTIPNWAYSKFNEIVTAYVENRLTAKYVILKENESPNLEEAVEKQFINHNGEATFSNAKDLITKGEIKSEEDLLKLFIFATGKKSAIEVAKMNKAKDELLALIK